MDNFQHIQKDVYLAAGFLDCTTESDPLHFARPVDDPDWKPKPVKIYFTDGRIMEVDYQVAIQRIVAGIAALV